jgi:hypothetical protein
MNVDWVTGLVLRGVFAQRVRALLFAGLFSRESEVFHRHFLHMSLGISGFYAFAAKFWPMHVGKRQFRWFLSICEQKNAAFSMFEATATYCSRHERKFAKCRTRVHGTSADADPKRVRQ